LHDPADELPRHADVALYQAKADNSPGFAVNRILCAMINEAVFPLQEGLVTAEDIDAGMKLGCNHPIGPLALDLTEVASTIGKKIDRALREKKAE
jgi:3-hydroxyacyl-CoA dehydrogenase